MVINILKDGTRVEDMTGYIVKVEDVPTVYQILHKINRDNTGKTKCSIHK